MKLNARHFQHLTPEDWRTLQAFEQGSKNHEVVPTKIAISIAGLHKGTGGVTRSISTLAKAGLIAKVKNASYDGYRLTYGGLDYLALHAHVKSRAIVRLGSTMGVGKESDIVLVQSPSPLSGAPLQSILKIHRLGRISFRTASTKRSYQKGREHASWHYLSRLSAQKEFQAMNILRDAGFRSPRPIAWNRHTIVMSLVPGMPLRQVPLSAFGKSKSAREKGVAVLYAELIELIMRLAGFGLIHGDMNEFNVLIEGVPEDMGEDVDDTEDSSATKAGGSGDETQKQPIIPHVIDFPQITSMAHPQAGEFFDRDIRGVREFFRKRYHFEATEKDPTFAEAVERLKIAAARGERKLDIEMEAAGYNKKASKDLDAYYHEHSSTTEGVGTTDPRGEEAEDEDEEQEEEQDDNDEDDDGEVEGDEGVDLFAAAREQAVRGGDGELVVPPLSSDAYEDLVQELSEAKLSPPQGGSTTTIPKTKAGAGWAI